jgi:hypothetical protein
MPLIELTNQTLLLDHYANAANTALQSVHHLSSEWLINNFASVTSELWAY